STRPVARGCPSFAKAGTEASPRLLRLTAPRRRTHDRFRVAAHSPDGRWTSRRPWSAEAVRLVRGLRPRGHRRLHGVARVPAGQAVGFPGRLLRVRRWPSNGSRPRPPGRSDHDARIDGYGAARGPRGQTDLGHEWWR